MSAADVPAAAPAAVPHRTVEDAGAILLATLVVALGVSLYTSATLLTSSVAGIALLLQYATGVRFGVFFALINVPFIWFSLVRLGGRSTLRTLVAVLLVSALSAATPHWLSLAAVQPLYAAVVGGILNGVGLLILFRHRTGLGGVNVLAIVLQERLGVRAGLFMLAVDAVIMLAACLVLPLDKVLLSALGAGITNVIIAANHRADRYLGLS